MHPNEHFTLVLSICSVAVRFRSGCKVADASSLHLFLRTRKGLYPRIFVVPEWWDCVSDGNCTSVMGAAQSWGKRTFGSFQLIIEITLPADAS